MNKGLILWHEGYLKYSFPNHQFTSKKYKIFKQKILQNSFTNEIKLIKEPIEWKYIEQAVDKNHLDKLKKLSDTGKGMLDPGTPAFKNMLFPARLSAQGTYESIIEVYSGNYRFAFNCLGGMHHATPTISRGGCIINDMGIAIKRIRQEGILSRIAILDFDFHPHDGTTAYFGGDGSVFLASIHESGWFDYDDNECGWDEGYNTVRNWGIKKVIEPEEYIRIINEELIPAVRKFQPEIILFLNGVDTHVDDPVVQHYLNRSISLQDDHFKKIAEILANLALDVCDGKIIVLGSGGYGSEITAKIWIQTIETFSRKLLKNS